MTRFSRLAFASVAVLVVTGVYQSWRGLGSWDALAGTTYGRLLTLKLVAVALLLGAAAVSRRWTARLATVDAAAQTVVRERSPSRSAAARRCRTHPTGVSPRPASVPTGLSPPTRPSLRRAGALRAGGP